MSYLKSRLALPVALVATLAMSSLAWGQCTNTPSNCSASCASGACATGGCGTACGSGFGYAGGACGAGHCGGCAGGCGAGFEEFKRRFCLITERNDAWPLPFNCWDRESYYQIWNQQYAHGLQVAHTLTSEYFDPNTNELNRAGESRVAWIVQNAPANSKQIFVYEDQAGPAMDQRLASVRGVVDRWYGHMGQVNIATSQLAPNRIPASYQQLILEAAAGSTPPPVIPIASGENITTAVN